MGYNTTYNRYEDYKKNSFAFAGNKQSSSKCNPVIVAIVVTLITKAPSKDVTDVFDKVAKKEIGD